MASPERLMTVEARARAQGGWLATLTPRNKMAVGIWWNGITLGNVAVQVGDQI